MRQPVAMGLGLSILTQPRSSSDWLLCAAALPPAFPTIYILSIYKYLGAQYANTAIQVDNTQTLHCGSICTTKRHTYCL